MSFTYFNKLNYTLANEDTAMELPMLRDGAGHVMAVCGSGGRVLPLLAKAPREVSFVDLSQEQLWLAELRLASLATLDHADFVGFWGYPPEPFSPEQRQQAFAGLELSTPAKTFFTSLFEENGWSSILYHGKWERTFAKLSRVARAVTRTDGLGVFDCKTREEQQAYLAKTFPRRRWLGVVGALGNASLFNALLYKGHFPSRNVPFSYFQYYKGAFDRLFEIGPARENFFLQIVFYGEIRHAEGNPVECDPEVFAAAKAALPETKVNYVCGNIVDEAVNATTPIDFLSLSDVPSYFSGRTEKEFMQRLRPALAKDAVVVIRSYLHVPWRPDLSGYENVTAAYAPHIAAEKTQMYLVDVYRHA